MAITSANQSNMATTSAILAIPSAKNKANTNGTHSSVTVDQCGNTNNHKYGYNISQQGNNISLMVTTSPSIQKQ